MSTSADPRRRLLLCSWSAFWPPMWETLERLVKDHGFTATVLGPARAAVPRVYSPSGYFTADLVERSFATIRLVPLRNVHSPTDGFVPRRFRQALAGVDPDVIWIAEEPSAETTREVLKYYYFRRRPTIACWVIENLWKKPPLIHGVKSRILCGRLDALLAAASPSGESVKGAFVPAAVPSYVTFLPTLDPQGSPQGAFSVPREKDDFWVGFVGRLCPEKGWADLIDALAQLPQQVKAVLAGDGPDAEAVEGKLAAYGLKCRVRLAGALAPEDVRALYRQVDVIVVPSRTTSTWKEQFGRVIAESMAAGVPVVGSTSGAIPEVIGDAGLTFGEGDPTQLAQVLRKLLADGPFRRELGSAGRRRFEGQFSVDAYAQRLASVFHGLVSKRRPVDESTRFQQH